MPKWFLIIRSAVMDLPDHKMDSGGHRRYVREDRHSELGRPFARLGDRLVEGRPATEIPRAGCGRSRVK